MNSIEEKLWNYIDGNCTADEQEAISTLIENDEAYRLKYHELLNLNSEFSAMDLEEPPMAFTYNIMEAIRTEQAQKPLSAPINKRIIMGITLFFVFTIVALLVFTLSNINLGTMPASTAVSVHFKFPNIAAYISKPVIEGFVFFDVVLALYLFDTYLRKKKTGTG